MAVIRVSGHPGAGKTTLCAWLSKELGYEYFYTGGVLREMAKEQGMSIEEFYQALSQDPGLEKTVDERMESFMTTQDNIIVEGRVAPFQESAFPAINILLTVSNKEGARRQSLRSENTGKAVGEIAKLTEERVKNERDHYRKLYGIEDHFDPKKFDIVLDTTDLKVEEACEVVLQKVKEKIR